ncbi:hypothetical protein MPTK1_7g15470 [Marchantia polymorpha subsp. ruderalis]|uniref:Uncharacterized protein n=2 Tax=Marchantia polymorpha TaxID=3197 RepID=A0AAF6BZY9_MARPO|nr:hypothetical protein MARPO_0009s0231 [Marchantia polymorpha]BBN17573.1 hypothetical protein Mp_7g15470 [Marchantia polymorpha subsp. ruderalis]|eukprot:PTQ47179.1 hypothetical protein MARPO_0009s0231 [Marchantia polymorpha]
MPRFLHYPSSHRKPSGRPSRSILLLLLPPDLTPLTELPPVPHPSTKPQCLTVHADRASPRAHSAPRPAPPLPSLHYRIDLATPFAPSRISARENPSTPPDGLLAHTDFENSVPPRRSTRNRNESTTIQNSSQSIRSPNCPEKHETKARLLDPESQGPFQVAILGNSPRTMELAFRSLTP